MADPRMSRWNVVRLQLCEPNVRPGDPRPPYHRPSPPNRPAERSVSASPGRTPPVEAEASRQRDLDAALGDAIEVGAHHRVKFGRRVCTRSDGDIVRLEFEALRRMQSQSNTSHPGSPS